MGSSGSPAIRTGAQPVSGGADCGTQIVISRDTAREQQAMAPRDRAAVQRKMAFHLHMPTPMLSRSADMRSSGVLLALMQLGHTIRRRKSDPYARLDDRLQLHA